MADAAIAVSHYVNAPCAVMRMEPNDDAEVVSQAFYSESVRVLQENGGWVQIETEVDCYQGWVRGDGLFPRKDRFLEDGKAVVAKVCRCAAHIYTVPDTIYGPMLTLPFESKMQVIEEESTVSRWIKVGLQDGRIAFVQRGDVQIGPKPITRKEMCDLSRQFLGLPYTWGGRTSFGYDCSGYVQMLYRQMGVYLPRDTKDQIRWEGFNPISIDALTDGDLIFFGLDQDKILHVGMVIDDKRFIHATVAENQPYVRISDIANPEWNGSGRFKYVAARQLARLTKTTT